MTTARRAEAAGAGHSKQRRRAGTASCARAKAHYHTETSEAPEVAVGSRSMRRTAKRAPHPARQGRWAPLLIAQSPSPRAHVKKSPRAAAFRPAPPARYERDYALSHKRLSSTFWHFFSLRATPAAIRRPRDAGSSSWCARSMVRELSVSRGAVVARGPSDQHPCRDHGILLRGRSGSSLMPTCATVWRCFTEPTKARSARSPARR